MVGMKEVVGVVAQLATVKYVPLAEVLAEDLYSRLAYVVVETTECRKQLEEVWASRGLVRVDVLAYDQLSSYRSVLSSWHRSLPQTPAAIQSLAGLTYVTNECRAYQRLLQLNRNSCISYKA